MTLPVRVQPEAADELVEAVAWYEHRRSGLGLERLTAADQILSLPTLTLQEAALV